MRNSVAMWFMWAVAACCLSPLAASAQQPSQFGGLSPNFQNNAPYGQSGAFGQNNLYNPGTQQLSPYLNLLRGNNSAVNYFNFVRPGLNQGSFGAPFLGANGMGGRQTFFPQIDTLAELDESGKTVGMRPTGHPFGFNNTLGYFGPMGARNAGGQGTMANKSGTMGGK